MNLHDEFFTLIPELNRQGIRYAVVGGIAMGFHARPRFTRDIDLLVHPDDLASLRKILVRLGYRESAEPWTFRKANLTLHRFLKVVGGDEMLLDILLANAKVHQQMISRAGEVEAAASPVRVASRSDLIRMKRARNSDQDRVDIKELKDDQD